MIISRLLLTLSFVLFAAGSWLVSRGLAQTEVAEPARPRRGDREEAQFAPEFAAGSEWINTPPLRLANLKGKVLIVHFWTNGCINCIHNYPGYRAWEKKYKDERDVQMIGIHTPEFDAEKDIERIKEQMLKNDLHFPVVVDNDMTNWRAWQNRYWPCIYVVDKNGRIRTRWEGELGVNGFEAMTRQVEMLRAEFP